MLAVSASPIVVPAPDGPAPRRPPEPADTTARARLLGLAARQGWPVVDFWDGFTMAPGEATWRLVVPLMTDFAVAYGVAVLLQQVEDEPDRKRESHEPNS